MKEFFLKTISKLTKNEFHPGGYWGTEMRFMFNLYESETVALCKKLVKPGMNVLDIGADIGYYSKIFSSLVQPGGSVYSFEPHPVIFEILRKNLRSLQQRNVYPFQLAVSDVNGRSSLFENVRHGRHSLFDLSSHDKSFKTLGKIEVEAVTIDDFLLKKGNPKIDFFKIDVEGGEMHVLQGMRETIKRNGALAGVVEFNAAALSASGADPSRYVSNLQGFGFSVKEIGQGGNLKDIGHETYAKAKENSVNLFCFKKPTAS